MASNLTLSTLLVACVLVFAAATAVGEESVAEGECFGTECKNGCCPWEDWFCCDDIAGVDYCAFYEDDCSKITTTPDTPTTTSSTSPTTNTASTISSGSTTTNTAS